jgi:SAM-dependent methyltransferase
MMVEDYRPAEYWDTRLQKDFNLRGTGHASYSQGYNAWLYRAKRHALRKALRLTGSPQRALDAGTGTGWVVRELLERGIAVDGFDITEVSVAGVQEAFDKGRFVVAGLGVDAIPFDDASYDVVTAMDVSYHIVDDAQWHAGIGDLARVLKPGGYLIASDSFGATDTRVAEHVQFRAQDTWREALAVHELCFVDVSPLYRWLSRDQGRRGFARLPDGLRGAAEYVLEFAAPKTPHMRCAVIEKQPCDIR